MSKCKNSGCATYLYSSKYHFCPPCYEAWREGGQEAVQARLQKLEPAPQVVLAALVPRGHSVVDDVALKALRDELAAANKFLEDLRQVYVHTYKGVEIGADRTPEQLLGKASMDHVLASAARSAWIRETGGQGNRGSDTTHCVTQWLKKIPERLKFRAACTPTQHPTAIKDKPTAQEMQLRRIESKLSSALRPSYLWPCFWAAVAGLSTATAILTWS